MISQAAAYSLRAVICLAGADGHVLTTWQIAERTGMSPGYLAKILHVLGRAGLIVSQRGVHGGHALKRPAHLITVMDVVRAAERSRQLHPERRLPASGDASASARGFDSIVRALHQALSRNTIASVLADLTEPCPAADAYAVSIPIEHFLE
jgi:Rrf2 family protein